MGSIAPNVHADRMPCGDGVPEGGIQEMVSGQDVRLQCTWNVFAAMGSPEGGRTGQCKQGGAFAAMGYPKVVEHDNANV
jgi:hypothetical protein